MKKIKYVKTLRENKFEEATGYYYKDKNNIEYAIDCETHYVTELTTGCLVVMEKGTLKKQIERIEERSDAVKNSFLTHSTKSAVENLKKFKEKFLGKKI